MSARVFNPLVMSEMRRMIGRSSSDGSGSTAAVARVRRDLFGPVNHEDSTVFVEKELAAIRQRESDKWGFDFVKESPLENGRLKWERVSPEENIPEAWAVRRLGKDAGLSTTTTNPGAIQPSTTQRTKPATKQLHMTDYMKQRKRSKSASDLRKESLSPVVKRSRQPPPQAQSQ